MEAFWSTLKIDLLYRRRFTSRRQARSDIFDDVEFFYNQSPIIQALKGRSLS
jgi:Integrase core domain